MILDQLGLEWRNFQNLVELFILIGKALKNSNAQGIAGNYYDIESGEEYWISGIKKNGTNRHWAGDGKVMIDQNVVDLYLSLIDFNMLDKNRFELVDILPTDKQNFAELENKKLA